MTHDPNLVVLQKSNWPTIITIASISGIFIIFVVALWAAGFFSFTGSDPSSKIVAAALALVGGLVAAVVSIIGIVLKYSIDHRTETRLQIDANRSAVERKIESDRASALQTQGEQRLHLEAAIRAIQVLGGKEGTATALQRAGALYALSSLNQHELTLDLTSYLLQRGDLEPNVASKLINRALKYDDQNVQWDAIMLLYDNAERMNTTTYTVLPDAIVNWDIAFPSTVREWAPLALGKILLDRPLPTWRERFFGDACTIAASLALAWEAETDQRLKSDVGAILKAVLGGLVPRWATLQHPKKPLEVARLMSEVENASAVSNNAQEIAKRLESWNSAPVQTMQQRP